MVNADPAGADRSAWGSAPGEQRIQRHIADDPNTQAGAIAGWTQEYDQLGPGRFEGRLTELLLDDIHLFSESTSHVLRQTCKVRSGAYWFGIPDHDANDAASLGKIGARPITLDALAVRPGDVDFELVTPAAFQIFGIVVKGSALAYAASEVEHIATPPDLLADEIAAIGHERKAHLRAVMRSILVDDDRNAAPLSAFAREHLQSQVLSLLFDLCFEHPAKRAPALSKPHRKWIVDQARNYMLAHRDRPLTIPELCTHLRVSRRMLQYCFQEIYGLSPVAYLRAIRLNGVRRDLLKTPKDVVVSVQGVAAGWGFWHLSQFSADYRNLFGMTPSQTLRLR